MSHPTYPVIRVDSVDQYHIWKWIDVIDSYRNWYEAYIVKIDQKERKIRVHYDGWKEKFDEWIHIDKDAERIAPLNTFTKPGDHLVEGGRSLELKEGMMVDCRDFSSKYFECRIEQIVSFNGASVMAKIRWIGFGTQFDLWLPIDSKRFATHRSQSSKIRPNLIYNQQKHKYDKINPSENNEQKFRDIIRQHLKCNIIVQASDGNCLFRSVSHQVYGDPQYHRIVREKCMEYIQTESEFFSNFIDSDFKTYINDMKRDGAWGDHVEIQAMSELYGRSIEIYSYSKIPLRIYNSSGPPIRLSYHFRSHYNSIMNIDYKEFLKNALQTPPGVIEQQVIEAARLKHSAEFKMDHPHENLLINSRSKFKTSSFSVDDIAGISLENIDEELENQKVLIEQHRLSLEKKAEEDLERAIECSLKQDKSIKNSNIDQKNSEANYAIQKCIDLGFSVDLSRKAYILFQDNSVSPEIVIQNMINYLLTTSTD